MRTRAMAATASAVSGALLLAGCSLGSGLYNVTLPGGANLGSHPYSVTVQFTDALDLVPQSAVKVNDVAVGRVSKIKLDTSTGTIALVTVLVNGDVDLPANAVASIDQTSLLGEKYVSLGAPLGVAPVGRLRSGDLIPVSRTTQGTEVETLLGALSEVLNGGGIGQLHDITSALNKTLDGNVQASRDLLQNMTTIVSDLNAHRSSITRALDALATLSTTLTASDKQITNVLTHLAPGIAELSSQRTQIIAMLDQLNSLSTVTVHVLDASKDQLISDLRSLAPVLTQLAQAGTALPQSLQVLLTYPFPDAALSAIVGDYVNAFVSTSYRTQGGTTVQVQNFPTTATPKVNGQHVSPAVITPPPTLLTPTTSAAQGLPSVLTSSPTSASASSSVSSSSSSSASSSSSSSSASSSASSTVPGSSSPAGTASGSSSSSKSGGR